VVNAVSEITVNDALAPNDQFVSAKQDLDLAGRQPT
jgi:hypothetical protein